MSPFMKGALGFLGCAGVCAVAYQIGKRVGREETVREIEQEEIRQRANNATVYDISNEPGQEIIIPAEEQNTPIEKVRKMHGLKNKIFGGTSAIKDLLKNPDGKQLTMTVENGDIIARISKKQGG